jgi:hypothetical protein
VSDASLRLLAVDEVGSRHGEDQRDAPGGRAGGRPPGASHEWLYPAWQFGPDGQVREDVARLLDGRRVTGASARAAHELLERRSGMTGGDRLRDDLAAGRIDHVLDVIRSL